LAKKTPGPKKTKESAADRQARARENYKKLRDAGFSSADATRYRYSTNENISQVMQTKTLPTINKSKQGKSKNYANICTETRQLPYVRQKIIAIDQYNGEKYMAAVIKELKQAKTDGYTYYSIVITFTWPTSMDTFASTPMDAIDNILTRDKLENEIIAVIGYYLEKYQQDGEDPHHYIEINLWDYSKKGKKAG
jgi:hypothetical protein